MNAFRLALPLLLAAAWAGATAQTEGPNDRAAQTCESAVADTVRNMRGREAQDVQFVGSRRAIAPTADAKIGVKGEGLYRSASSRGVPFTYSCAFDADTGATSGVLFRDAARERVAAPAAVEPDLTHVSPEACEAATAEALKQKYPRVGRIAFDADTGATSGVLFRDAARERAAAPVAVEPDLTHVSPEACEAATAEALKQKYPRVGRIAFDVSTRKLLPAPNAQSRLEGQVAVERAPGMALVPITYRCMFAPRTGALVSTSLDG